MSKDILMARVSEAFSRTSATIREVGLREGLQSTDQVLATDAKIDLFRGLVAAGCTEINPVAFVNPRRMPQMADAEDFLRGLGGLRDGVVLWGLTLNDQGLERALVMRGEDLLDGILTVFSLNSDGMAANGITSDSDQLLDEIAARAERATAAGLRVAVFLSGVFGDRDGGAVAPDRVIACAERIRGFAGVDELIVSDSTGHADPLQLLSFLTDLSTVVPPAQRLGIHLHNTRGAGLANVVAALLSPFENLVLDAAFGGWGGDYPYVEESFGNVATEDLGEMLIGSGINHGLDIDAIIAVTRQYAAASGRPPGSKLPEASTIAWKRPSPAGVPA